MNNIKNAFKELRKLGYYARLGTGSNETARDYIAKDKLEKYIYVSGPTWRRAASEYGNNKEGIVVYCHWAGDGDQIISVFQRHSVETDWEGDHNRTICIILNA